MLSRHLAFLTVAAVFAAPAAFSGEEEQCMNCHAGEDFEGMSTDAIIDEIKNGGFPPHKKYAELGDEELKAVAAAIAGD